MAASEAQILANRRNAALSTGPRTAEGKDQSRRNALKHGLAAAVVVPEEEVGEVALRVAMIQDRLAADDDGFALILAERAGYLSMRLKRCFLHETAMTARRVRDAQANYDDERKTAAEGILSYIANEPPTGSRQLLATPEGVDILIAWLEEIAGEVDSRWSDFHCFKFDEALGRRSMGPTSTRVRGLTDLITKGSVAKLPPGEVDAVPEGERRAWALAEIGKEVAAELARLRAHRATLDHPRFDANRAEAGKRALQGTDRETALARKYENAAALAFERTIKQIAAYRHEQRRSRAEERAEARATTDAEHAGDVRARRDAPESIFDEPATEAELASFVPRRHATRGPIDASNFTIGKAAPAPAAPAKPPRYTP